MPGDDHNDDVFTADPLTMLEALNVNNPTINIICDACRGHKQGVGTGTTTLVSLVGLLAGFALTAYVWEDYARRLRPSKCWACASDRSCKQIE